MFYYWLEIRVWIVEKYTHTIKKREKCFDKIIVTGSHLLKQYGNTSNEILRDKIKIFKKINIVQKNDNSVAITKISTRILRGTYKCIRKI